MDVISIENQIAQGVRDWQMALMPGSSLSIEQQTCLQKLVLLLAHVGLLVFDKGYHYTKHSALPLVAYLNHGATIKVELSRNLLYPLLDYLVGTSSIETNPLASISYVKPYEAKTSLVNSQTRAKATEHFCLDFSLGLHVVQLLLTVSKSLTGPASLSLCLTGYNTALQFPENTKDKTPTHPFWQYQAYLAAQGKQLYLPIGPLAIKGTLTAEEFAHIKELSFDPQLISRPPNEHAAAALAIHHVARFFSYLKQENLSPEMQSFLASRIYPLRQAYINNIEPADYRARHHFLLNWLGRKPHANSSELIKLHADLTAHAITELSLIEQEMLLKDIVKPLMHACSRELMALSDLG